MSTATGDTEQAVASPAVSIRPQTYWHRLLNDPCVHGEQLDRIGDRFSLTVTHPERFFNLEALQADPLLRENRNPETGKQGCICNFLTPDNMKLNLECRGRDKIETLVFRHRLTDLDPNR